MVVNDGDFIRACVRPSEHYAPLIIDADGVPASPLALQSFKRVAGRNCQVREQDGAVELEEFPASNTCDARKTTVLFLGEKLLCILITK